MSTSLKVFVDENAAELIRSYEAAPEEYDTTEQMASLFESPEKFERRTRSIRRRRGSPKARRAPTFDRFEKENE